MTLSAICADANSDAKTLAWSATFDQVGPFKIGMSYDELRRSSHSRLSGEQNFIYSNDKKIVCGYLGFADIDDPNVWFTLADDKLAAIHVSNPKIAFMNEIKVGDLKAKLFEVYHNNARSAPEMDAYSEVDGYDEVVEVQSNNGKDKADFMIKDSKIADFHIGDAAWRVDIDKSCQ